MKKLVGGVVLAALLGLAGAQPLSAQDGDGGWGAFLDWINKLSGPRMVGPAASAWFRVGDRAHVRASIARRWSGDSSSAISPAGSGINMWSFQGTFEYEFADPLAVGGGIALHRFGGDADAFWHTSFPLYLAARFPRGSRVQVVPQIGTHYFPKFDTSDFSPLTVTVDTTGGEFVFWFGLGLEIRY